MATYSSVLDMVRDFADDLDFVREFERRVAIKPSYCPYCRNFHGLRQNARQWRCARCGKFLLTRPRLAV